MSRRTIERWFPIGDYTDRLNELWGAIQEATGDESGPRLLTEDDTAAELRAVYEDLRDEALTAAKRDRRFVRLQALGRGEMRALKAKHPPRTEGDEDSVKADRIAGMDLKGAEDDLVYASIIEPAFTSRSDFDEWADEVLSDGEFEVILQDAWELANVAQFDPKSLPASPTPKSDATSG